VDISPSALEKLLRVDTEGWLAEAASIREYFAKFGDRLPEGLKLEVKELEERLRKRTP
jgi:phosphoenolpyruvate carboxykinase (GTP)